MIRVVHPGSGWWLFTHPRFRIRGSKRHRIPDPDPQHCKNYCEFAKILLKIPFFQAPEQKRRARKVRLQDTTQLSAASSPRKTSNKEKDLQIRNGLGEKSNSFALWKFIGCELIERDTNSVSMCVFAAMMAPVYCLRPRFSGENRSEC